MSKKFLIVFSLAFFLATSPAIVYAENTTASKLTVSVDRFGTTISIDVPADFTYSENPQKNEIEITLENCRIQFQGCDFMQVPSFSPLFESIEVSSLSDNNSSTLKIKLVDSNLRPVISVSPSLNRLNFNFKSSYLTAKEDIKPITLLEGVPKSEQTPLIEKVSPGINSPEVVESSIAEIAPVTDEPPKTSSQVEDAIPVPIIEIPKVVEESLDDIEVEIPVNDVQLDEDKDANNPENTEIIEDLPMIPVPEKIENPVSVVEIPKIIKETIENDSDKTSVEDVELYAPEIIEPDITTETVEQPESEILPLASEFPEAFLEAIHYSQGRINMDVITIEFSDISPTINYELKESGFFVITMHNLQTPIEILPSDHLKRQVNGSIIKSLSLTRFMEMGLPALQIKLIGTENFDVDVEEMEGMIELTIQSGDK